MMSVLTSFCNSDVGRLLILNICFPNRFQARQDLVHADKRIRQWEIACLQLLTPQERLAIGDQAVGIDLFVQKVAHCQQDRLMCAEEINSLKAR